jgi:hypothetical protein
MKGGQMRVHWSEAAWESRAAGLFLWHDLLVTLKPRAGFRRGRGRTRILGNISGSVRVFSLVLEARRATGQTIFSHVQVMLSPLVHDAGVEGKWLSDFSSPLDEK